MGEGTRRALAYAPSLLSLSLVRRSISPPAAHPSVTSAPLTPGSATIRVAFRAERRPLAIYVGLRAGEFRAYAIAVPSEPVGCALELACAEGHFTAQLAPHVDSLVAADIWRSRSSVPPRVPGPRQRHVSPSRPGDRRAPGPLDLLVVSEVLYYVGDLEALRAIARKISQALMPGGHLVTADAHVLADDPDRTGFDWEVPFGARVIIEELSSVPELRLVKELRTPLYRIACFQADIGGPPGESWSRYCRFHSGRPAAGQVERRCASAGADGASATPADSHVPPDLACRHPRARSLARDYRRLRAPARISARLRLSECDLDAWRESVEARRALPGRPLVLTFDDGCVDFAEHAWPILRRYGFGAHVMLVSGSVGRWNTWDRGGDTQPLLDWDAIKRLRDEGVEFGAHSVTHRRMTGLSPADIAREAIGSREEIERRLGGAVPSFAYPYGDEDDVVRHLVGAAGFEYGLTCRPGSRIGRFLARASAHRCSRIRRPAHLHSQTGRVILVFLGWEVRRGKWNCRHLAGACGFTFGLSDRTGLAHFRKFVPLELP